MAAGDTFNFTPEQQEHINRLIGEARVKAREKAEADATEAARVANLAGEQKWQELAEKHQARIAELEPLEKQVEAYEGLVAGMLKDAVIALGEPASKAVDGLPETMTTIEKLKWLHENEELFQASGGPIGTPRRPGQKRPDQTKSSGPISRYPIRL